MHHVGFGRTGLRVSQLCLGTMTFGGQCDEDTSRAILDHAFDSGITFVDTADMYPNAGDETTVGRTEEIIGRWLVGRRQEVILATKCFAPMSARPWDTGGSRKHILDAVDASLRRLGTDYIDLYQLHMDDRRTPLDETLAAFDDVVRAGKVRYVGCSNYLAWRLAKALGRSAANGWCRYESVQPRYNLLFREFERELFPLCEEEELAVIPYNPLAGGLLTGKHARGTPDAATRFGFGSAAERYQDRYWHDEMFDTVDEIVSLADEASITPARLAVGWILAQPFVTAPIVGATRPDQLDDAVAAVDKGLDADLVERLDELTTRYRYGDARR